MNKYVFWHWPTFFLFIILGILLAYACHRERRSALLNNKGMALFGSPYIGVYLIWIFIGIFRLIDAHHGGTDTPSYIETFKFCFNKSHSEGLDIFFKYFNLFIRSYTSDYHIYLAAVYFIFVYSYTYFINTFIPSKSSVIPIVLTCYLLFVGFSSLRSNLSSSLLLISIACLMREKKLISISFALMSILTHVSMAMYLPVLFFFYFFKDREIKFKVLLVLFFISVAVGVIVQNSFIAGGFAFLEGLSSGAAYTYYATRSQELSFFDSYVVIAFPQMAMGGAMLFFWGKMKIIMEMDGIDSKKIKGLFLICCYDVITIPIEFTLGVYRGYEYLMLPRLVMWGVIVMLTSDMVGKKHSALVKISYAALFLLWIYTRFNAMYESSHLMPYKFDI